MGKKIYWTFVGNNMCKDKSHILDSVDDHVLYCSQCQ